MILGTFLKSFTQPLVPFSEEYFHIVIRFVLPKNEVITCSVPGMYLNRQNFSSAL